MRVNWFACGGALAASLLGVTTSRAEEADTPSDADFAAAIAADQATASENPPATIVPATVATVVRQMNPDISLILDAGLAWFDVSEHLRQGGHAMDDNGFAIQGLEFAASASVDPFFRFDMNFELSHMHLEEVYLTTLALPCNLQARLGYFNAQFGRQNPQHLHTWHFTNPPLSQTRFMSEEHFSGPGAEVSLLLPLPWYVMVFGEAFGSIGELALRSSTFGAPPLTKSGRIDGLEDFVYVSRIVNFFALSDDWSLNFGVDGAWGQSPYVPDNRADLFGADLYLKWRPISTGDDDMAVALTVEGVMRDTQIPGDFVRDWGGYAQLDFQIDRSWIANVRADYTGKLCGTPLVGTNLAGKQWRGSGAVTVLPSHFAKVRIQLDVGKDKRMPTYFAGFFQVEVSAGEHGAHTF